MHAATPQPKRLAQYQIMGTLAVGLRWRIYRGFDPVLRRSVALKAIPKDLLDSYGAAMIARVQNEARAATCLNHPGIVGVYGCGEDSDLAFIAMEYVEGWRLKERFRVPVADAVNLIVQLLEALDYAHDQGIVHLEIKPSNLLLTSKGQLRITNFGVARLDAGTPDYMSPEQIMGLPVDRRSDVFSAGIVFYELLTGVSPFPGPPQDLVDRVCKDKQRPPSEVNRKVPRVFDRVCAKSLAKAVDDRYPTAQAFCDGIRGANFEAAAGPLTGVISNETVVACASGFTEAESDSGARPGSKVGSEALSPEPARVPLQVRSSAAPATATPIERNLSPELKPQAKIDLKQRSVPIEVAPDKVSRLEELLGKQPDSLAGYLKDSPPELEEVIHAFVASVQALIAMGAANGKNEALIPQSICFDWVGKATIRASQLTVTHGTRDMVSNPRYAAPEMFAEKDMGGDSMIAAAHVYALGVMFYEILLGRKLFEKTFAKQRTDLDWLRWHADLESKAPRLKSLLPDCPAGLSDLLESMMEKHAEKRTTDLEAILSCLRDIARRANKTIVLRMPTAPAKATAKPHSISRKKGWKMGWKKLAVLLLLVLALAAGAIVIWQTPGLYRELISRLRHLAQKP